MNLKNLKKRLSPPTIQRSADCKLNISGAYYTYTAGKLKKSVGDLHIPLHKVIDIGTRKYRNIKYRTRMIFVGVFTVTWDKMFGSKIFDLLEISLLNIVQNILIALWVYCCIRYIISRKNLLEIITKDTNYCISRKAIELEDLKSLVKV